MLRVMNILTTLKDYFFHAMRTISGFYLHPVSKSWIRPLTTF